MCSRNGRWEEGRKWEWEEERKEREGIGGRRKGLRSSRNGMKDEGSGHEKKGRREGRRLKEGNEEQE